MVIGNGMIAQVFEGYRNDDRYIIFASGVSNSTQPAPEAFEREEQLLRNTLQQAAGKTLVYFSTCSIYDTSMQHSAYVLHKLKMEALIRDSGNPFTIFRLSNPVGYTNNKTTIINFLAGNIQSGKRFELWQQATRNIIDIDDMFTVCNEILQQQLFRNQVINIANPVNYPLSFIVSALEKHFNLKAVYTTVQKGNGPMIDTSETAPFFKKFNINFDENYLERLLQKYFPVI